jgi:transcriptional regulator with XRE-family HTH domain
MLCGMSGSTPRAREIGGEMRAARESAKLTTRQLGDRLGVESSTISRWERGERTVKPRDITRYLVECGADAERISDLVELALEDDVSPWLAVGITAQRRQMAALLKVERTATRTIHVSPSLIPGPLQTAEYARAIMTRAGVSDLQIETRVHVRMGRRDALVRPEPVNMLALVCEAALWPEIGGRAVLLEQLRYLLEMAERPNIDLRIIPAVANWTPALEGHFVLIESDSQDSVVYLEGRRAGLFFHEPEDVSAYEGAVELVKELAMSLADSSGLIANVITKMETT